jgi:phosphatidylglycerophosphate synthase
MAEPTIADIYRLTKKTPDLLWNEYVCRPVAAVVVHAVAGTAVTPNQITLASLAVALVGAILMVGVPGYFGLVLAVLVYEASYVLDCADGMLARLRGTQSVTGHLLDFLMDELKAFFILGAAAARLWLERGEPRFLLLGVLGLVALASGIGLTTFVRRPEIATSPRAAPESDDDAIQRGGSRGAVAIAERAAKFLIHYPSYIWLAALAGHLEWYLLPYVLVNAAYSARTFLSVALRFGRV